MTEEAAQVEEQVAPPADDGTRQVVADAMAGGETAPDANAADVTDASPAELAPLEPPASWSAEHQTTFRGIPREAQQFLLDRSGELDKSHHERLAEIEPMRAATSAWGNYWSSIGVNPPQMIDSLARFEYTLRTGTTQQKEAAILQVMRDYGVTFAQEKETKPEDDPFGVEKQMAAYRKHVDQRLDQITGGVGQMQRQQQEAATAEWYNAAEHYKNQKGADGNLLHPYFDELIDDMSRLAQFEISQGRQPTFDFLYSTTSQLNPGVKAKIQAAEAHKQKAAAGRKRRTKAASGGLEGGAASAPDEANTAEDTRDVVQRIWEQASA